MRPRQLIPPPALLIAALLVTAVHAGAGPRTFRPKLKEAEVVAPFLRYLEPGHDAFTQEREAEQIQERLAALAEALKSGSPPRLAEMLARDFRGSRLTADAPNVVTRSGSLEVLRSEALPLEAGLDGRAFEAELSRFVAGMREVSVAELSVVTIDVSGGDEAATDVRYDIAGPGRRAWRIGHTGRWRMKWRRDGRGWRVSEWTAATHVETRAPSPIFTETTAAALGANDSLRRQLAIGLDAWMATFDSVLTRDSNGHHGVSVGDADGDGWDDLYVAQPSGLPNRLYRARGDGTFEDITERAGVGILDDTAQSLFADVDNDGDQDLLLATATRPLLFANDGRGRFTPVADAFRLARPIQGLLTSMAMADYDRDGFADLYICVYAYFYGAGENETGPPMPYHDARNGPPAVLFRNDGRGRFVDVTREAGLDAGNDRFHFAAAWADYDADGWPDLFVANDFGAKNLYRNLGRRDGQVTFEDVAARAGVLDHGAGMSAAFFDYDNDGRLDIYAGNMWSAPGLRVTSQASFLPDAARDVRALYRRHARGNTLLRNAGDGRFEDVTLAARAEMGRWAWSSDALDFDSDGWEDVYVVNGMLTRAEDGADLEGFFWRQVVARSPLARLTGTPYDDAWRAINQLLIRRSIASRQRNVFLRNDGGGGFDDVSAALGLDLEQDGRSFAVFDADRDGDPDLAVMAARQAPQLRVFRNDFDARGATLAIRLAGTASNRDAVGARATVATDTLRRAKTVQAGSGFLSQHSKELLFGLGASAGRVTLTVEWPSGRVQTFAGVSVNRRFRLEEGGELRGDEPLASPPPLPVLAAENTPATPPRSTWLYEPFPAPDFAARDARGETWSLAKLAGRPALLLFTGGGAASREAVRALARGQVELEGTGIGSLVVAVEQGCMATAVSCLAATHEIALGYAIAHRHLFMNRQDLILPTAFLLDASGRIVKAYREAVDVGAVIHDAARIEAPPAERLGRACPFPGTWSEPPGLRNHVPYGRELMDQGLEAAAAAAFERAALAAPSPSTLYRLGTLLVKSGRHGTARAAFERALALQPELSEASNDLGALLARAGDLPGAIERFRAALAAAPEYPDAINNLGYALLLSGRQAEARDCYEKALRLQPGFPEALNNLGMLFGRAGELDRAEAYFRQALARREDYAEAANNMALVLVARGRAAEAIAGLERFLERHPSAEATYITLAKVHLHADRRADGRSVLERLLQRNPEHAQAREIARQLGGP